MDDQLILKNRLKVARAEKNLSQTQLAELVGVSRNTISSIETGQFNPHSQTGPGVVHRPGQEIRGPILFRLIREAPMRKEEILDRYRREGTDEGREQVNRRGDDAGFTPFWALPCR